MRFYWVQDRVKQSQYAVYWKPGKSNKADYFMKHHPPTHHSKVQGDYLCVCNAIMLTNTLQGCVEFPQENMEFPHGNLESSTTDSKQTDASANNLLQTVIYVQAILLQAQVLKPMTQLASKSTLQNHSLIN
eukprot:14100425-Ditylum_brightwellii.AAC.1